MRMVASTWLNDVQRSSGVMSMLKWFDQFDVLRIEWTPCALRIVKKSCGTPSLLSNEKFIEDDDLQGITTLQSKWVSPPNAEMLKFLVTISKSKDFYAKIVDSLKEDFSNYVQGIEGMRLPRSVSNNLEVDDLEERSQNILSTTVEPNLLSVDNYKTGPVLHNESSVITRHSFNANDDVSKTEDPMNHLFLV
ncbi:hypothetical protein Bhyg_05459 [Pseudolycoriella hygida]|uniref:Uncharacterized protein n=1 Tax=Pseudolycoriella hygida TaxID=35572 RepID=A0A9Q0S204_9DIPT|nr:hypothetical protein Bhyg_05459 [Pseudolycoriella hygida]